MKTDILIVGGSAAGLAGGITARRFHPDLGVTIVRHEEKMLVPCGIPYIFGTLDSVEKDIIPDTVTAKNKIEVMVDEIALAKDYTSGVC